MVIQPQQFKNIDIPKDKVLARLGFTQKKASADTSIQNIVDSEIVLAKKLILLKQVVASSKIEFLKPNIIKLQPNLKIISSKLYRFLNGYNLAFGFAVTIGPALEEKRQLYISDKQSTKALVLDAVGSVIAEELAEITNKQISERFTHSSKRFSPGYGDWDISGQADFLKWLDAEKIGIKLNNKFIMTPEKSVSAIIGIKDE
ncbi:vitamin B12 dependent-methionine synthase activation domain-containing protein [Elusimicrobiota bacterium]